VFLKNDSKYNFLPPQQTSLALIETASFFLSFLHSQEMKEKRYSEKQEIASNKN
jgi:hypothetical protein